MYSSKSARSADASGYYVQVGAFSQAENARATHDMLVRQGYSGSRILAVKTGAGGTLHVVKAGVFAQRGAAEQALQRLRRQFPSSFINS